jgi:hypothetical protein
MYRLMLFQLLGLVELIVEQLMLLLMKPLKFLLNLWQLL